MDLRLYPLDKQVCVLQIASCKLVIIVIVPLNIVINIIVPINIVNIVIVLIKIVTDVIVPIIIVIVPVTLNTHGKVHHDLSLVNKKKHLNPSAQKC